MNIKNQLELMIARLERANSQLQKMLSAFADGLSEEEINAILDEIIKNNETINKLKKGL